MPAIMYFLQSREDHPYAAASLFWCLFTICPHLISAFSSSFFHILSSDFSW
jgi:hypothetical protein